MAQVRFLFDTQYEIVQLSEPITALACLALEQHQLRALDAIHLATALFINNWLHSHNEPLLTFLATDRRLLDAAAEGLTIFDPATDDPTIGQ